MIMKNFKFCIILAINVLLLASCATSSELIIDVRNPARVYFPENIVNVAIVDNAGGQLNDSIAKERGIDVQTRITSLSKKVFVESLTQFLDEENYFGDVKLSQHPVRMDTDYGHQAPLKAHDIQSIALKDSVDAIISLDLFNTSSVEALANINGFYFTAAHATMDILFRIYNAEGKLLSPAMASSDSIIWMGDKGISEYDLGTYEELALQMSEGMVKQLVPYWEQQQRIFYSDGTKLMKEASKYAKAGNWTEAINSWENAFANVDKNKQKAKIASNIAFGYESTDNIDDAVKWIRIASNLIQTNKNSDEHTYINWYKFKLLQRQQNQDKVLKQLGVNEAEDME